MSLFEHFRGFEHLFRIWNPDPYQSERRDPDPHQNDKQDPDPQQWFILLSDARCFVKTREIAFYEHRESISRVLIQNFQKPAYKSIQTILI